ncbi:NAD(P)/FAD-dependent oxidoreductase [Croceivirga sp. JEA036]|uniref:NAD(P)/FAD-dependent oxidoreductase n=1 Tax=Croceivirga sp. JEA036 TaxID=2721162 RepID=UPI00143ADA54|nr:FAD-dependent oxidoreductase [Croceivirga sp. JEA036]NJB35234.1 oxidoreductase [Croceivirga sp. JEA036]
MDTNTKTCVIVGASHAGANCAMELRKQGWEGTIVLIDADENLPYHRPPLSKAYLSLTDGSAFNPLFAAERYEEENITLALGVSVTSVDATTQTLELSNGTSIQYDALVLATGASAFVPPIAGINASSDVHVLRSAKDALAIQAGFKNARNKNIVVIGGGYIGLETAASLKKLGGNVTVLEREERLLARVAPAVLASFFQELHTANGVMIKTGVSAQEIKQTKDGTTVMGTDGVAYPADLILVGVGVRPNIALATQLGVKLDNGITVNEQLQTSLANVYALGDVAQFHHPRYQKWMRLESVQNAVDQAKAVAANIVGNTTIYDALPWFWSDQYHIKLQMVGLSQGYTDLVVRTEEDKEDCFSIWYFKDDALLAVDAVNNGKAFVLGTKFIKNNTVVDKEKLADASIPFKPNTLIKTTTNVD